MKPLHITLVFFLALAMILTSASFATPQRVLRGQPNVPIPPRVETSGCPSEGTTSLPPAAAQANVSLVRRPLL